MSPVFNLIRQDNPMRMIWRDGLPGDVNTRGTGIERGHVCWRMIWYLKRRKE